MGVLQDKREEIVSGNREKKFITSPADIEVHLKIELQDANVSDEQQNAFKALCNEFKDIFSVDSGDIGKTSLIEMEIDTGNSPPITQKPYTLPLKHAVWVQKELEILEKAGVIVRSVSPWASPIVVIPKRTAPGEPSTFDMRYEKWKFKRCPFGLAQAPAYFQRPVNEVLSGLTFAFGYLDDILVFSPNMETHWII